MTLMDSEMAFMRSSTIFAGVIYSDAKVNARLKLKLKHTICGIIASMIL